MLHTLSLEQALSLWSDLDDAYYGKNGFGGDTAEIYIYRVLSGVPRQATEIDVTGLLGDMAREAFDKANHVLHDFLLKFADHRNVRIEVDGRELGPWLKTARYTHRVQVRVLPRHERRCSASHARDFPNCPNCGDPA